MQTFVILVARYVAMTRDNENLIVIQMKTHLKFSFVKWVKMTLGKFMFRICDNNFLVEPKITMVGFTERVTEYPRKLFRER